MVTFDAAEEIIAVLAREMDLTFHRDAHLDGVNTWSEDKAVCL